MDLVCKDCGEDEVVEITAFGEVERRYLCASCGSENVRRAQLRRPVGYQPPSVSQMARRLRTTEENLPPSAMERAIAQKRWEEDAEQWRDDLVSLLSELEPE